MTINHLKNRDAQRKTLAVAFGRHAVKGHLCWSRPEGTPGPPANFDIYAYNALGEGEWDSCEAAYYRGIEIPSDDYHFHTGALAEGMDTGPQQVDTYFDKDVPHTRTAAIGYKAPHNIGDLDTEKSPPDAFEGLFRTMKCPNFDMAGNLLNDGIWTYSANPARCIAAALMTYGRLPNLPETYSGAMQYWRTRIDWTAWTEWRDYCDQLESVDYLDLPDLDGFGLTVSYYNGNEFDEFVTRFVQPVIDLNLGTASPAAGVNPIDFSARFEGRLKAKKTGELRFHLTHDDGARLYIAGHQVVDEWDNPGAGTGDLAVVEGEAYDIVIEWRNTGGASNLRLDWSDKIDLPQELISSKYLYPKVEDRPRYESHVYFNSPTNFADVLRTILFVSNSAMQDVNGKLRFYCLEQLLPEFMLDNSNIDSFTFRRRDILQSDAVTSYEAKFRDLDSQFLEEPVTPIHLELDYLTRKNYENVKVIDLFNTTRWQARKVLEMRAKLETGNDLMAEVEAKMALTYPLVAGDLVTVEHRKIGPTSRTYLVREATDGAVAEASGTQTIEPEKRSFILQEWS